MDHNQKIDQRLMELLSQLKPVPERDPQSAARRRARFLLEAQQIAAQGVSQPDIYRHNMWKDAIQSIFAIRRKEQSHMFGIITTLIVIFTMVLGGGGATVVAAQSSLPDQALYPVKVWSENVRTSLVTDPEAQFNLAFQFTNRRAEEIYSMAEAGKPAPEAVMSQMQHQLDLALQVAANQPAETGNQLLERARDRLHQQDQLMQQLEPQTSPETTVVINQVRQMIQQRLSWVEDGLADHNRLQEHLRLKDGTGQKTPGVTPEKIYPEQNRTFTPASGETYNQAHKTPKPASSYNGDGQPLKTHHPEPDKENCLNGQCGASGQNDYHDGGDGNGASPHQEDQGHHEDDHH